MSTQDGISHKSTKYTDLLQYYNIVIHIQYSNVTLNPLHTADYRKLE
jgi:hypothetical protein